ncbi:hypothetical protein [Pseudomonas sp. Teo4]|uniref:hypothetical protein n=1 Tax=Pseudomonas sp. Teo4 TaxID=3064528 RepID=UPI002ACB0818|nr:hypothetical protein [Pseudomonas sp. Teo4]
MGHFELGPHRPATRLGGALQIRNTQKNVTPFAGTDAHSTVAVRTDQLISTHGKYLHVPNTHICCKNASPAASVLTAIKEGFFIMLLLMSGYLIKMQGYYSL